jgi:hypothetical protein
MFQILLSWCLCGSMDFSRLKGVEVDLRTMKELRLKRGADWAAITNQPSRREAP